MSSDYHGGIAGEIADEDYDDYSQDDDWYDDDDYDRDPDPEDYEIARSYEELYAHQEKAHGGHQCDCRPSAPERLAWRLRDLAGWFPGTWYRARYAVHQPWTVRILGAEVTVRLHPRECGACSGRGWFYSKTGIDPLPMPPGYDGVCLCGCGTAIGKLAGSRRAVRRMRKETPF